MATERAEPKVLKARSPAPVSATELPKPDKATVAVTGGELLSRPQDSRPSNSARAQPGHSRRTADLLRHLWKSSPSQIRSTLRKLDSSGCKVKYYWKYH